MRFKKNFIHSTWIKVLNIRLETLQLVQEGAGNALEAISAGKDFFGRTPATKRKDGQLELHKIKKLCTTKKWSPN
jgi:hypothetical protein